MVKEPFVSFWVPGTPATKGSTRPFKWHAKDGRSGVSTVNTSKKAKPWAGAVGFAAMQAMQGRWLFTGPVRVMIDFFLQRPKDHFQRNGNLKPSAPFYCTSHARGDGDKLERCTWDAMTGVVYTDDKLIVSWVGSKTYSNDGRTGARITIDDILHKMRLQ